MKIKFPIVAAIALFSASTFADPVKTLQPGDVAPKFSLKAQDGRTYSSDDKELQSKVIVLEWFNNDCPYVKKFYGKPEKTMQKLQDHYTHKGAAWFLISSTRPSQALKEDKAKKIYKERQSAASALLLDSDGSLARAFGAKTTPHIFIIGMDGKIAYQGAVDDKPSFRKDSLKGAKNYIAPALDALLDQNPIRKVIAVTSSDAYGCSVKIDDAPSTQPSKPTEPAKPGEPAKVTEPAKPTDAKK